MNRIMLIGAIAVLSLGSAMITAIPSFASGKDSNIAGKITKVSSTSVQVQTPGGSVTDQLTGSTRVMKMARGSFSDLAPGTLATVTLASGTTTITAILVSAKVGAPSHSRVGTRPPHASHGSTGGTTSKPNIGTHHDGQIVNVANGQLILGNRQGQTATYTLGQNVTVTKIILGQLSDLTVGETVRIAARPGSTTALAVIIESA